jgi:putative heme transporter
MSRLNEPGGLPDENDGPNELTLDPSVAGAAPAVLPAPEITRLAHGAERPAQHWKTVARNISIVAVALGVVAALYSERSNTAKGLDNIRDLNWAWAAAASLAEVMSMMAFGRLYQVLLQANKTRLRLPWILAASFTANAISAAVPVVGSGMASRQTFRWFREGGADSVAASVTLMVAGVVSTVTLATVATATALLSGNPAAAAGGVLAALALVALAAAIAIELRTETGRARLLRLTAFSIRCGQRAVRRPRGQPEMLARSVLESLQRLELGASTLGRALLLGLANWWADVACLAFAMKAAGSDGLSIGKVLLVWTAAVGAATLSPTPAGIGAVEIAMVAAMAGVGVRGPEAITAVLVYRVITLKGAGSLWALTYATIHRHRQRLAGARPVEG